MRKKLLNLRQQLEQLGDAGQSSSGIVELDQARVGRLSRMDALQGQAMSQASDRRRQLMLKKVTAALGRIEQGTFGRCLSCDEQIGMQRLEFDPTATLCIECAEQAEQS